MNGMMNENFIVKECEFDNPLIKNIDSMIDDCFRDCHQKYFHKFDHIREYDLNFTNIVNNETVNFTISDKSMGLYEINKIITIGRGNGFISFQINKLTIELYSNLSHINIHYYLKILIAIMHGKFLLKIKQNPDCIRTFFNDRGNPFLFACRQW